jgi:hypothetical protein
VGDVPFELSSPDDHLAFDRFDSTFLFLEGDTISYQVDFAYYVTIVALCEADDNSATPHRPDVVTERSLRTDSKTVRHHGSPDPPVSLSGCLFDYVQ